MGIMNGSLIFTIEPLYAIFDVYSIFELMLYGHMVNCVTFKRSELLNRIVYR